jgi:hypothetical protein
MISDETFGVRHRDTTLKGADASAPSGINATIKSGDMSPHSKWKPYPKYKVSGGGVAG